MNDAGVSLAEFLGDLGDRVKPLEIERTLFAERRRYTFDSNWKVFVDNYLDGGYHIPFLLKGLHSVLEYGEYRIQNGERY